MEEKSAFSPAALSLSVVTATLSECCLSVGAVDDARATLLWSLPVGLLLSLLVWFLLPFAQEKRIFSGETRLSKAVCGGFLLCFAAELLHALFQAQTLCWQQFSSLAIIGFAPALLCMGWRLNEAALNRTAAILWWFAAVGALLCLLGLWPQLRWERLLEQALSLREQRAPQFLLYAEYFAAPLLCEPKAQRRAPLLPWGSITVQAGFVLGTQLLFGAFGSGYDGVELLRALSVGTFSRLDALIMLLWLVMALSRICLLCRVLHRLWSCAFGNVPCEERTRTC